MSDYILVTYETEVEQDSVRLPIDTEGLDIEREAREAIRRQFRLRDLPEITIVALYYSDTGELVNLD